MDGSDPRIYNPDLSKLFHRIHTELTLRGLNDDRIATFKAKVEATNLLLLKAMPPLADLWLPGHRENRGCHCGSGACARRRLQSAHRRAREADAAYIPPGRLRRYDVIILDEISQIDADVWQKIKVALNELHPGPLLLFVGDEQQLQPVVGRPQLLQDLATEVEAGKARREFFADRIWESDLQAAARKSLRMEVTENKKFMFLTVTNKAAAALNQARLQLEFPEEARQLAEGRGWPAEVGRVLLATHMRVRLTHNVNKDEGFVNGNMGHIRKMLRSDVFIMESSQQTSILVYPVTVKGQKYLPVSYGYATTMRRAQGATLDAVGLLFDRRLPDSGYAYVGTSRAKSRSSVYHLGHLRQTAWLPVGGDPSQEHTSLSALSESSDEQEESEQPSSDSPEAKSSDFDSDTSHFRLAEATRLRLILFCWLRFASLHKALIAFRAAVARLAPKLWEHCGQGATFGEAMQDAFRAVARENSRLRHDFSQLRRLALERLLARVDEANPEEIVEQALNAFLSARGDVEQHLFEDVLPTLKELKQRGLRIGSVTNGNAELSLHAPRLSELLDFQISSANAGAPKPRAAPFLAAAAAAGTWPCQVLHVGDSPADDVLGAKRMGMKAVHLRRGTVKDAAQAVSAAPDATIASLSELPALLTNWDEAKSRL
eukprot:s710_g5.t1